MPVLFDSSAGKVAAWQGVGANGSMSFSHTVNTLATGRVAIVGAFWMGLSNTSGGSMAATFGGVAMTGSTPLRWVGDSTYCMAQIFTLPNPSAGSQTVQLSVSSMGGTGGLAVVSATYSGVETIGSVVTQAGSSTNHNSVTVSSVSAAYRVVTVHCFGSVGNSDSDFTGFNNVRRADKTITDVLFDDGEILLGDAAGAATVTGTATQNQSSSFWGAFGVPLSPSIVKGDASLSVSIATAGSGHLYRVGTPSPKRTWLIES